MVSSSKTYANAWGVCGTSLVSPGWLVLGVTARTCDDQGRCSRYILPFLRDRISIKVCCTFNPGVMTETCFSPISPRACLLTGKLLVEAACWLPSGADGAQALSLL